MIKIDLGAVSAYALAVEHGFEGTEEEFARLQAESGQNAQAAAQSAEEAKRAAELAADEAAAGVAEAVATDAAKAEEAAMLAQSVKDSIPEDYAVLSQDVAALSEEIGIIFAEDAVETPVTEIPGIISKPGFSASAEGTHVVLAKNSGFDSYWCVTDKDIDLWFAGSLPAYVAVCVGSGYESQQEYSDGTMTIKSAENPVRYRKSEGNLPTEESKLHVAAGSVLAFSVTAGAALSVYGLDFAKSVKDEFRQEVLKAEKIVVEYTSASNEIHSPNALNIYIPQKTGYVKYVFAHAQYSPINADVWHMANAYVCDTSFNALYPLTAIGEWECALHLEGRDDFSGGLAHGDEVLSDILLFVDGMQVAPESLTGRIMCDELRIVQKSHLYDPADHTTQIAVHTSEHVFTNGKDDRDLVINQTVKWIGSYNLTSCYLAMLPITKDVSSKMYSDADYAPMDVVSGTSILDAKEVCLYADNVFSTFGIGRYVDGMKGFLVSDNGSDAYNKCYFVVCHSGTVETDTLWQTSTYYGIKATI